MPHTGAMIRGLARLFLLRFLPRRVLPVLTAWEVLQIVREHRRARREATLEPPANSLAPGPAARRPPPR